MAEPEPYPEQLAHVGLWLAGKLTPGERVVADARGVVGHSLYWDLVPPLATTGGVVAAWRNFFDGTPAGGPGAALLVLGGMGLTLALTATRRPVYVAVTTRQVLVVQMRSSDRPVRVLAALPVSAVRITTRTWPVPRVITCAAADGSTIQMGGKVRARLRLAVFSSRARFDGLLGAIAAGGGLVDVPSAPDVSALGPPA